MNRFFLITVCVLLFIDSYSQVIGGLNNGSPAPKEVKAAELSKGSLSGDVNLFTGTYSSSYHFGTVSSPSGLSYSVDLNYTSSRTGGDNVPNVTGVPYGEGWNIPLPSISVTTEEYEKYSAEEAAEISTEHNTGAQKIYTNQEAGEEGQLFWFSPMLSIPGRPGGRLVFKKMDDNRAVFVLSNFDEYVEAQLYNNAWKVFYPDGTVYELDIPQVSYRTPTNQRVYKDASNNNIQTGANIGNLTIPKGEVLNWYASSLYNLNLPREERIQFFYRTYGLFNYYKEYKAPNIVGTFAVSDGGSSSCEISQASSPSALNFLAYRDIFLESVSAINYLSGVEIDKIELNHSTVTPTSSLYGLPLITDPNVERYDSMYNCTTVYYKGPNQGISEHGQNYVKPTCEVSDTSFDTWRRYRHWKSNVINHLGYAATPSILNPTNPYVANYHPSNQPCNGYTYYFDDAIASGEDFLRFDHSILESERINTSTINNFSGNNNVIWPLPAGDVYEFKSVILNTNYSTGDYAGFCNFDINIASGNPHSGYSYNSEFSSYSSGHLVCAEPIDKYKSFPIFSTFHQAVKWNSLYKSTPFTSQYLVTSNFFSMPNLPLSWDGFNIQIGPANSDNNFSKGVEDISEATIGSGPSDCGVPNTSSYRSYLNVDSLTNGLRPTDPAPSNFGIGLPWHMMRSTYINTTDAEESPCGILDPIYSHWWYDSTANTNAGGVIIANDNLNGCRVIIPNEPTLADKDVILKAVELRRYSKNPYMLTDVKHYHLNGDYNSDGMQLVDEYKLEYSNILDAIIDDQPSSSSSAAKYRNVFLLRDVRHVPVHPATTDTTFTYDADTTPSIHLDYTVLSNPFYSDTVRTNTNVVELSKITDQLGGVTELEYYSLSNALTNISVTYQAKSFMSMLPKDVVPSLALAIEPVVKKKTVYTATPSFAKVWDYTFDIADTTRDYTEMAKLPDNYSSYGFFREERGFKKVKVTQPAITYLAPRVYAIYKHHGIEDGKPLFGKLYQEKNYNADGTLIDTSYIQYKVTLAYNNAVFRDIEDLAHTSLDYIDYQGLSRPETGSVFAPDGGTQNPTDINDIGFVLNTKFYENYDFDYVRSHNSLEYLNSYFVRKTKEVSMEFYYNKPPTVLSSFSRVQPASSLINSTVYVNIGFKNTPSKPCFTCPSPIMQKTGAVNLPASPSSSGGIKSLNAVANNNYDAQYDTLTITNVTDYDWYDADSAGNTACLGFRMLNGDTSEPEMLIGYEPSWELYSKKSYSPNYIGQYNKEEYFYYYDLVNDQIHADDYFEDSVTTIKGFIDGLDKSHNNHLRGIAYQVRKTFVKPNENPIVQSTYYHYDARWFTDTFSVAKSTEEMPDQPCPPEVPDGGDYVDPNHITNSCGCVGVKVTLASFPPIPPDGYFLYWDTLSGSELFYFCPYTDTISEDSVTNLCLQGYIDSLEALQPVDTSEAPPIHINVAITNGDEGGEKLLNIGRNGTKLLLLRKTYVQVDTIRLQAYDTTFNYSPLPRYAWLPRWSSSVKDTNDCWLPQLPFATIVTNTVIRHNMFTQIELEANEVGLLTHYIYTQPQNIWYVDALHPCNNHAANIFTDIGLPHSVTVGYTRPDSLTTYFEYYHNNSVKKITDPNNVQTSYTYDEYGRLSEQFLNGNRTALYRYHNWANDTTLSFAQKAEQNYVDAYTFLNKGDTQAIHVRKYVDPLGRTYQTLSEISPNANLGRHATQMVAAGQVVLDNWDRATQTYSPFITYMDTAMAAFRPVFNTDSTQFPQYAAYTTYENDQRSRTLRSSPFGQSAITGKYNSNTYSFIKAADMFQELYLANNEYAQMAPYYYLTSLSTDSKKYYVFRKTASVDPDGKETDTYTDAFGQKVAVRQQISSGNFAVTLFYFDSRGLQTKVWNPLKQLSTYNYNLLGQLYQKITVDGGTTNYMYNISGNVRLEQDANGRKGFYVRNYDYDAYGRLVNQERIPLVDTESVNNPLYYATQTVDGTVSPFQYSQTVDTFFGYWQSVHAGSFLFNPDLLGVEPYLYNNPMLPPTNTNAHIPEKHFQYGPVDTTGIYLHPNAKYWWAHQTGLKGKASFNASYNNDGTPVQYQLTSYDINGRTAWDIEQFNPDGIDDAHRGDAHRMTYPDYNLQGSLLEREVDLYCDRWLDLQYYNQYDSWGRLWRVYANRDTARTAGNLVADYAYDDALGLLTKTRYFTYGASGHNVPIDSTVNTYDIRRRLTDANSTLLDWQLYYDASHPFTGGYASYLAASKNYNGNINATQGIYKLAATDNDPGNFNSRSTYGYMYDGLNRLTAADAYLATVNGSGNPSTLTGPTAKYGDESYTLDKAGNLLTLVRDTIGSFVAQTLTYGYQTGTNRLVAVTRSSMGTKGYRYDVAGNLTWDENRTLDSIYYGRANLPYQVDKGINRAERYLYGAGDERVYKAWVELGAGYKVDNSSYYLADAAIDEYDDGSDAHRWTFYVSGRNRVLHFKPIDDQQPTDQGVDTGAVWHLGGHTDLHEPHYYVYDHLGNTRIVYTPLTYLGYLGDDSIILSLYNVLDYFPYGKILREFRAVGQERYLTTGHERDEETGLDNRGARWYDSDIGRFLSIDPKAEQYANWSAYNYVLANPLLIVDPDGRGDVFMQLELNPAKALEAGGGGFGGNGGGFSFPRMPLPTITVQEAEVVQTASQAMTPQYVAPPLAPPAPTLQPALVPVPAAPAATHPYEAAGKPGAYSVDADGNVYMKATPSNTGVIYKRTDKSGNIKKPYIGQAKSPERYAARQKEHARANPDSDFEFEQIDQGDPGKDLNQKEQKALDENGGPTNKSNPDGGTSNKKNVIRKPKIQ